MSTQTNDTVLFVHYNKDSEGSALDRMERIVAHVASKRVVRLIVPGPGPVFERLKSLPIEIEFRSFNDNTKGYAVYAANCLKFVWYCWRHKIKLIHILDHTWWKPAELLAARILRIPFISMITFNRPADARNGGVRWASKIVANSHSTATDFIQAGLEKSTCVIHNAVDLERFESATSIRSELFERSSEQPSFLIAYVGILHPVKGIDVLLRAVALCRSRIEGLHLCIVGAEKKTGYEQELRELARELEVEDAVTWCGVRRDIPSVMKSIDALVVPSREEPFGFVTIEAGAAGSAVIASSVGGIVETIRDDVDGLLVPPNDCESLARAIVRLQGDAHLREVLSRNFYARVREKFSYERMLREWDAVYSELLV